MTTPTAPNAFPYTLIPHNIPFTPPSAAERDAYIRRYTRSGDPAADALVAAFAAMRPAGAGRALFERALTHGLSAITDPPAELTAFLRAVDVPAWAQADQLELAARVIGRTGSLGLTALTAALLGGYLAPRPIKPLTRTGDLERMAPRRLAETLYWFAAVTRPGGLERGAAGWHATARVRLMHAMVRARMSRRTDWDWAAWDNPLNASQLAGTNALFAAAILTGTRALGMRFTSTETEAVCHYWTVVGRMLGVEQELLPHNESALAHLLAIQGRYEFTILDPDSARLAGALLRAVESLSIGAHEDLPHRLAARAATAALCTYARPLLGTGNANYLGLPDHPLLHRGLHAAAAAMAGLESVRRIVPGATRLAEALGRHRWETTAARAMAQHHGDTHYGRHDLPTEPSVQPSTAYATRRSSQFPGSARTAEAAAAASVGSHD